MHPTKFESAVSNIEQLFMDGYVLTVGLSGKDSFCVSDIAMEALKRARARTDKEIGPLYLVTTSTTLDNMEFHEFIMSLHDAAIAYASEYDLPVYSRELKPSLFNRPMVEYVGRGKLLRTPENSARGRDCTVSWKIEPMKALLKTLEKEHRTPKIASASGTWDDESAVRKANIAARGEAEYSLVDTPLGKCIAPIKHWSTQDVWQHIREIEKGDLIDFEELLAIQFWWFREGGEEVVGEAIRIWDDVVEKGNHYPIPITVKVDKKPLPPSRWINLSAVSQGVETWGLEVPRCSHSARN